MFYKKQNGGLMFIKELEDSVKYLNHIRESWENIQEVLQKYDLDTNLLSDDEIEVFFLISCFKGSRYSDLWSLNMFLFKNEFIKSLKNLPAELDLIKSFLTTFQKLELKLYKYKETSLLKDYLVYKNEFIIDEVFKTKYFNQISKLLQHKENDFLSERYNNIFGVYSPADIIIRELRNKKYLSKPTHLLCKLNCFDKDESYQHKSIGKYCFALNMLSYLKKDISNTDSIHKVIQLIDFYQDNVCKKTELGSYFKKCEDFIKKNKNNESFDKQKFLKELSINLEDKDSLEKNTENNIFYGLLKSSTVNLYYPYETTFNNSIIKELWQGRYPLTNLQIFEKNIKNIFHNYLNQDAIKVIIEEHISNAIEIYSIDYYIRTTHFNRDEHGKLINMDFSCTVEKLSHSYVANHKFSESIFIEILPIIKFKSNTKMDNDVVVIENIYDLKNIVTPTLQKILKSNETELDLFDKINDLIY
jgi:hypothetical protein